MTVESRLPVSCAEAHLHLLMLSWSRPRSRCRGNSGYDRNPPASGTHLVDTQVVYRVRWVDRSPVGHQFCWQGKDLGFELSIMGMSTVKGATRAL